MNLKETSIKYISREVISVETITITALALSSFHVGHETLVRSSLYVSFIYVFIFPILLFLCARADPASIGTSPSRFLAETDHLVNSFCTCGEARTPSPQFWRLMLYQLSYARVLKLAVRRLQFTKKCSLQTADSII